jgi:hypothetical protein
MFLMSVLSWSHGMFLLVIINKFAVLFCM